MRENVISAAPIFIPDGKTESAARQILSDHISQEVKYPTPIGILEML